MENFNLSEWITSAGYTLLAALGGLLGYVMREHDKGNPLNGWRALAEALAQVAAADADKPPRLHQADAGRLVRGLQQPCQQLRCHLATCEVTHVAALGNGAVDRRALLGTEGMFTHGRNNSAAAVGSDGR